MLLLDAWRLCCRRGQSSEPAIPAHGVSNPTMMRDFAGSMSVVLANKTAVDVIVVKPVIGQWFGNVGMPNEVHGLNMRE